MPTVARRFRLGPRKNNDFEAALSAGPELTRSTAEASALPVRLVCAGAGIRRPEPGLTDSRGAPAVGPDPISEGVRAARPGAAADGHGSRTRGSFELLERDHVLFGPWSLRARPCRFARMRSGAVQGWWRVRLSLVSPDLQSNLSSLEHSDARFTRAVLIPHLGLP